MMTFHLLKLSSFLVLFLFISKAVAEEALMLEGSLGTSNTKIYSPQESETDIKGNTTFLRFHFPLLQGQSQALSFTLSNQFFHGKSEATSAGQSQNLALSGFGVGLSYRLYFFILGADYQQTSFDQIAVGPQSTETTYSLGVPNYYGGLLYQFGRLGVGLIYSYKKIEIPAEKSQLSSAHPYEEANVLLSLTYHFEGRIGTFIHSLFTGRGR
jgi:predicted porin